MNVPNEVKSLFGRIQQAETGGLDNKFIRTLDRTAPGGSSAYGPAQVTMTLAKDFKERHGDLFTPEEKGYLDRFIAQGQKFLRFGNVVNLKEEDKKFDYGGEGELTSDADKQLYGQVVEKMLNFYHQKFNGDVEKIGDAWRFGETSKRTLRDDDPRYFRIVVGDSA